MVIPCCHHFTHRISKTSETVEEAHRGDYSDGRWLGRWVVVSECHQSVMAENFPEKFQADEWKTCRRCLGSSDDLMNAKR